MQLILALERAGYILLSKYIRQWKIKTSTCISIFHKNVPLITEDTKNNWIVGNYLNAISNLKYNLLLDTQATQNYL